MAPHMTERELDYIQKMSGAGQTPQEIQKAIGKMRARRAEPVAAPDIKRIRAAMAGASFKRSRVETRGRPKVLSNAQVKRLIRKKNHLQRKHKTGIEITLGLIKGTARVRASESTVSRRFKEKKVRWRKCREKPVRTKETKAARVEHCKRWSGLPHDYFTKTVDMTIDNHTMQVPTTPVARAYLNSQKTRGTHRTPKEGLLPQHTKPSKSAKHRRSTGGKVSVLAGVIGHKVVVWDYLKGPWSGAAAAKLYKGVIKTALNKHRPGKARHKVMEDNDPTGYKSGAARAAKREAKIDEVNLPKYSMDLNPWDYSLFKDIDDRVAQGAPKGRETIAGFKKRARLVALRTPEAVVRKAFENMKPRIKAVVKAKGGNIERD